MSLERTYLLAYESEDEDRPGFLCQRVPGQTFREQHYSFAGIIRGNRKVTVFCNLLHGQGEITKDDLREIAEWYLDGNYVEHDYSLRD